jgi:arylsulfatase A-like enzyme
MCQSESSTSSSHGAESDLDWLCNEPDFQVAANDLTTVWSLKKRLQRGRELVLLVGSGCHRVSRTASPASVMAAHQIHRPSRLYKMFTTEGGIRVPFIGRYSPLNGKPNFTPGSHNDAFSTAMDLAPTMLEIAGVAHPARDGELGEFRGRQVEPMRGSSWVNWIEGEADRVHDEGLPHGWELHGRAALRIGNWKIVWIGEPEDLAGAQVLADPCR